MTASTDPSAQAVDIVEDYLAAMGRRDIAVAARHLAPGAVLQFPGGHTYSTLDELVRNSQSRYRWIDKHRDRYEAAVQPGGSVLVVSLGRLFGENLQGVAFDGVRYVDVFTVRDRLIVEQMVFNDLRETGVLDAVSADALSAEFAPDSAST